MTYDDRRSISCESCLTQGSHCWSVCKEVAALVCALQKGSCIVLYFMLHGFVRSVALVIVILLAVTDHFVQLQRRAGCRVC